MESSSKKHENNTPNTVTYMEQASCDESDGKKNGARFRSPVYILIHSFRHRLVDPDGVSAKAAIDALVHAKVLANDTTEQVKEIRYLQTKVGTKNEEKTEITIEEV